MALIASVEGVIGPASAKYVKDAVEVARKRQAEVLILRIDTPGGLVTSMRVMIEAILASPVPVVGYVAPPGAHAASAGTYILYATTIAAMAPGTNVGAATPVQIGGSPEAPKERKPSDQPSQPEGKRDKKKDKDGRDGRKPQERMPAEPVSAKAVNDAVAFIRSLAELHGRNADWAEKAVREAASLSAKQALAERVIDILAADMDDLMKALDGRKVTVGKTQRTLSTSGIVIERIEPGFMTRVLGVLANPNIAVILMLIGIYGMIFEFANPGTVAPGVIGAICLVLGLYSLHQLPLDYAGLALMALGIAFMVAEAFTPTFGVLGLGGITAFVIGAAMLIDTDIPAFQLSWTVIGGAAAFSGAFLILLIGYLWRTHGRKVESGAEQMIGSEAVVLDWSGGEGYVWAHGERWRARGGDYNKGDTLTVRAIDGLTLVAAAAPPAPAAQEH